MKANKVIIVRFREATGSLPARLKAMGEGWGSYSDQYDETRDLEAHARIVAEQFIEEVKWPVTVVGFGSLSNGDFVATLESSPVKKEEKRKRRCVRRYVSSGKKLSPALKGFK